jgi:hypothetical protein
MPVIDAETDAKILELYQLGKGSIQDYARIYRCTVEEVLQIVGETDLAEVEMTGDLVDEKELGPSGRGQVNPGEKVEVPFSTN